LHAKEAPSVVAEMRGPTTPPPPAPAIVVEEGEAPTEATVTQAALEAPSKAGPSVEGVVVVLDEDSAPPPASKSHDAVAVPVLEPAQVPAAMSFSWLWRCRCPLRQWKFKVLPRPQRRWSTPQPEFLLWSRR
jgi:hypothetical protein